MAEVARKPDVRELVGIAVNTSALTLEPGHERALDRIAALGAASLAVSTAADRENVTIAGSRHQVYGDVLDPRDVLVAELGPMLWHLRYGGQYGLIAKAVSLYAHWLSGRRIFEGVTDAALLERFAARVMHEWLSDRCIPCGGSGKLERTRAGGWIRPRGSMQRNAVFRVCSSCNGTRRAMPSHTQRRVWLGLELALYESERWGQRFNAALGVAQRPRRTHAPAIDRAVGTP
jgi:hypothetical protein